MDRPLRCRAFTLLEVLIALMIVGLVLGAMIEATGRFARERVILNERVAANSVAWNRLMAQYLVVQDWTSTSSSTPATRGQESQAGQDWYWEIEAETTLGEDFYRYQVRVYDNSQRDGASVTSLAAYFIAEQ